MLKTIILLSIIIEIVYSLSDADYCNIESCQGNPHTICTYKSKAPAAACRIVLKSGLTAEEKKQILDLHNELRQKVANGKETRGMPGPQPRATNMKQLEWDNELADIAQRWANQCNWGHDQCRDVRRFPVGQNVAFNATTGDVNSINVKDVVKLWYEEVQNYDGKSVSKFNNPENKNGKQVAHYTQFVWAETDKLGCGAIKYPEGGFNRFYLVCNYGPAGNFFGEPVYQTQWGKY